MRVSLVRVSLVIVLAVPVVMAAPASAQTAPPSHGQVDALTNEVNTEAGVIHRLTEQLDQARLQVDDTSARLVSVTRQHQAMVAQVSANQAVLSQQAVVAYMNDGVATATPTAAGEADPAVQSEYLQLAAGDVADTGDQLRNTEAGLRTDMFLVQQAQQANLQATTQLQELRTDALATAATEQQQLDGLQAQLLAATEAAAAASARNAAARDAAARAATVVQGLPVNNGLVTLVEQAAGLPAAPVVTAAIGGGNSGGVWLELRRCESSDNYAENTGNGFYGAYQFSQSTWTGLGYPGRPDQEPPAMQDAAAMKDQAISGWGQWPACSAALGLT